MTAAVVTLDFAGAPFNGTPAQVIENLRDGGSIAREWIIGQIEAQTKPPKPAEPTGLGAVVEDADGMRWVQARAEEYPWRPSVAVEIGAGPLYKPWDQIDAVRVLSEGVPA